MSTEKARSIPVDIESEQSSFRLFELPPELLESLSSGREQLYLKARPHDPHQEDGTEEAVLCSSSETWHLRQVQSSNTLFLLRSSSSTDNGQLPLSNLSIFASCTGTVETMKMPLSSQHMNSAKEWLVKLVPPYNDSSSPRSSSPISRSQLLDRVPFSQGEIEEALHEFVGFEYHTEHAASMFLPSSDSCLDTWKQMIQAAEELALDLTRPFVPQDVWRETHPEDVPWGLFAAVLERVGDQSYMPDRDEIQLNETAAVNWTGILLLTKHAGSLAINDDTLLREWRTLLPDQWHINPTSQDLAQLRNPAGRIDGQSSTSTAREVANTKEDTKRKPGARDWHKLFKKSRK